MTVEAPCEWGFGGASMRQERSLIPSLPDLVRSGRRPGVQRGPQPSSMEALLALHRDAKCISQNETLVKSRFTALD